MLPLTFDLSGGALTPAQATALAALEKQAARTAIESLASLAKEPTTSIISAAGSS